MSCESEWRGTHHDEDDIEVFVMSLDKGFIIPNHLPLVHHMELIKSGVVSPSGSEGRSGGIIEAMRV